jgi:hypothetical protein
MGRTIRIAFAVILLPLAFVACSRGSASAPERPVDQASATAEQPAPDPTPAPATSPEPVPAPEPAPGSKIATPAAKAALLDPGGEVEVAPTVAGVTRIGAAKCKMCHKLQYESWSGSAHAKRNPPLDCEGCHGPGSEYKAIAVMKDPAKARAAGLVIPAKGFCATCHTSGWNEAMLTAAHAHKPK